MDYILINIIDYRPLLQIQPINHSDFLSLKYQVTTARRSCQINLITIYVKYYSISVRAELLVVCCLEYIRFQ